MTRKNRVEIIGNVTLTVQAGVAESTTHDPAPDRGGVPRGSLNLALQLQTQRVSSLVGISGSKSGCLYPLGLLIGRAGLTQKELQLLAYVDH